MEATAIILAGGKSRRFGKDKTLLQIENECIVKRIVKECQPIFNEILIVSNSENKFGIAGTKEISDIYRDVGPLGGIHAGLLAAHCNKTFVTACDMPFFSATLAEQVVQEATGYDVMVPRDGERIEPLFACYHKGVLPKVELVLNSGRGSIRALYPLVHTGYLERKLWRSKTPEDELFYNINYPEDYKRFYA